MNNQTKKIISIISLISAIIMVLSLFLPYSSATPKHSEWIDEHPDTIVYKNLDLCAKDLKHISMIEYAKLYPNIMNEGIIYLILVAVIGIFSVLTLLFSFLKKPIATTVFSLFAYIVFLIQNCDYSDRGVIPSTSYDWGIGFYIFHIAFIFVLISSIITIINKKKTDR